MGVPSSPVEFSVPTQLLGLELIRGDNFSSVHINSSKLVRELLKDHFKDGRSRPNKVPVGQTFKFSKEDVLIRINKCKTIIVGVTIFLVTACRADSVYASTQLARYMSKPGYKHYRAANCQVP